MELLTEKYADLIESAKFAPVMEQDKGTLAVILGEAEKEISVLLEGTVAADITAYTKIMLPLIRRVFPVLIANNLLGVQPMTGPQGFIYSFTKRYLGAAADATAAQGQGIAPASAGLIIEVSGDQTAVAAYDVGATLTSDGTSTPAGRILYREFDAQEGVTRILLAMTVGTTMVAGDNVNTSDALTGIFSNEASWKKKLKGYAGPYSTALGEVLGKDMRELGFSIDRTTVTAKTQALKGQYTEEMRTDLQKMHGLNAENEIMSMIAYELQAVIDTEVVDFVNDQATVVSDYALVTTAGRWELEDYRLLGTKVCSEGRKVGIANKKGSANVVIVTPGVATALEQLKAFADAPIASAIKAEGANEAILGKFERRLTVIQDLNASSEYANVIYKGADSRDAIAFFSPYVPVSFTKITREDSGQPSMIAKSRYAVTANPIDAADYARAFGVSLAGSIIA